MRIVYFSDIHLEIREVPNFFGAGEGPDKDIQGILDAIQPEDVVVMAGDIGSLVYGRPGSSLDFAEKVAKKCKHVVYVPGNHEYHMGEYLAIKEQVISEKIDKVSVLDRSEVTIDGVRFLGATLWTDYAVMGHTSHSMSLAERFIADHRVIRYAGDNWFGPAFAREEHIFSRKWLMEQLTYGYDPKRRAVIVTHHCPHLSARNEKFPVEYLTAAFCSNLTDVLDTASAYGCKHWIFGHDHGTPRRLGVKGVTLLSAQLGYPREETGWVGPGILEI